MALYEIVTLTDVAGTAEDASAALEVLLQSVDDTKTIRLAKVFQQPDRQYIAVAMVDA